MPDLDPSAGDFYDLVVIGRGYSASTYLFTSDLSWCKKILIIGGPDAWEKIVRGDGIVNHANYIYARDNPDQKITPKAKVEEGNKKELKDENAAILKKSVKWLKAQGVLVTDVAGITKTIIKTSAILAADIIRPGSATLKQGQAVNVYSITYDDWKKPLGDPEFNTGNITTATVKTLKVVYCGGAGPQADFYNYDRETRALRYDAKTFMDLDSFMRSDPDEVKPEVEGTSAIALLGPNAGVDAAVVALNRKFKLYWLISGPQDSDPAWLSTKHYAIGDETGQKAIDEANKCIVNYPKKIAGYPKDIRPSFTGTGNDTPRKAPYKITFPIRKENQPVKYVEVKRRGDADIPENKLKDFSVDYVVYATGQDPNAQEVIAATDKPWRIGPAKVLGPILANEKLTPIYDVNQRFGNWFECALGLKDSDRSAYTGLEVLGASALALANFARGSKVQQAYFSHTGSYIRALDSTVQPGTKTNDALKAIQNSGWNENANTIRLYDHFDRQGEIPTVATAMGAIMPKLYSQTLIAADQLGVIKSQIEAITGFDLVAASSNTDGWALKAANLRTAIQDVKTQILALPKNAKATDLSKLKSAVDNYITALINHGLVYDIDDVAEAFIALLPPKEQAAIAQEGVTAETFAWNLNEKIYELVTAIGAFRKTDGDYLNLTKQERVIDAIGAAQKWLTNLEAVFQAPTPSEIRSAINFNGADRTQLAVLLSALYPSIPVTNWRPITAQILEGRKVSPWGYNPDQVGKIKDWLKAMNEGEKSVNEFPSMS
jgi:hypothetical protein